MGSTLIADLPEDRREELLALVNIVSYARDLCTSLATPHAAALLEEARNLLVAEVEAELNHVLSKDNILRVATTPAGRC
ncbi:hypothetical protein BJF93_08540 [Xaviernesmea oryzae]|uniref:Uncharacterized protein n=1 Tax=Xaviernesmea oryzae TaxID=464029 RepID=A0A1Q9B0W9_9HYPH|nr:hypothetical protein [Xaviernesmea oryzae]OLP61642.1 hypothetical protein BJF93_08540 [Xaviernesmea oryzae]SEL04943.1 hypothetical protein SAMN04487976_105217 [Xaviernesmea oryzae]